MLPPPRLFWGGECTETQALMAIGVGVVFEVDGPSASHSVLLINTAAA